MDKYKSKAILARKSHILFVAPLLFLPKANSSNTSSPQCVVHQRPLLVSRHTNTFSLSSLLLFLIKSFIYINLFYTLEFEMFLWKNACLA